MKNTHIGREIAFYYILFYISKSIHTPMQVIRNCMKLIIYSIIGFFFLQFEMCRIKNRFNDLSDFIYRRNTSAISWSSNILSEMII